MNEGKREETASHPVLRDLVARLVKDAGDHLVSVVLYGPAVHGDANDRRTWNLVLVLRSLDLEALASVSGPVHRALDQGLPMPRLLSPDVLASTTDVFPIELLDISSHHRVLHGRDPFTEVRIDPAHLRLQCERELREKMMRLQEAYLEARGRARALRRLMLESYPAFALVFRGCLRLLEEPIPTRDLEVVRTLCKRLGLEAGVFEEVEAELHDRRGPSNVEAWFRTYYRRLTEIVEHIDRWLSQREERAP
jgi:hypothetical protein